MVKSEYNAYLDWRTALTLYLYCCERHNANSATRNHAAAEQVSELQHVTRSTSGMKNAGIAAQNHAVLHGWPHLCLDSDERRANLKQLHGRRRTEGGRRDHWVPMTPR